jgi:ABC-type multidrug transport system ATPase subunit
MSAATAVEARNLTKRYGAIDALNNVTLDVHRGEMFG